MPVNNETVQFIGIGIAAFFATIGMMWGTKKGDGKPPPDRAPNQNETREALIQIRELLDSHRELNKDQFHEISRQLDRIESRQLMDTRRQRD